MPSSGNRQSNNLSLCLKNLTSAQGQLRFTDGLRIDGEFIGDVIASGDARSILVIIQNARVTCSVQAGHITINGEVLGPVRSDELLELQPKARVVGDVQYESLEMHQGASICGELRPLKAGEKPALKLAASNAG